MKSQARPIVIITIVFVGCLLVAVVWWKRSSHRASSFGTVAPALTNDSAAIAPLPEQTDIEPQHAVPKRSAVSAPPGSTSARRTDSSGPPTKNDGLVQKALEQGQAEYLSRNVRPINLYGMVVDQNQHPVEGANVTFSQTYNGQPTPRTTDSSGHFELSGVAGRYLTVETSKMGYYATKTSRQSFDYSPEGGNFQADSREPVIFQLQRKGAGADLITAEYGASRSLDFSVPRDGSPVRVDFFNRKIGSEGQMEVSQVKPAYGAWQTAAGWSYRLAVPDGGFVETSEEFPFQAPESGYQPVVEFSFQKGDTNWTERLDKTFYIAFGNPRRYGRIHVETSMTTGTILEYAINPSGSPNLEPK